MNVDDTGELTSKSKFLLVESIVPDLGLGRVCSCGGQFLCMLPYATCVQSLRTRENMPFSSSQKIGSGNAPRRRNQVPISF